MKRLLLGLMAVLMVIAVPMTFAQTDDPLVGTRWQLESYGAPGAETLVVADSTVTLEFQADNQVNGSGGCNSYGGNYTVGGDTITFSEIVSTLMACLNEDIGGQETAFFDALQSATRFELADDQLTIWYGDDQQLHFVPGDTFVGTHWQLESFGDSGAETPLIADTVITLEIRPENQVVGTGGCNDYNGMYAIDGDTITFTNIISTLLACGEDDTITQQETAYLDALQKATRFEVTDGQLTIWYGENQQLNFVLVDQDALAGTQWQLESLSADRPVVADSIVTLEFAADNQANGSGGCNSYSTTYNSLGDSLTFAPVISTKMACTDGGLSQQEQAYFEALQSATRYELTDDQLTIWYGDADQTLEFTQISQAADSA